MDVTTSQYFNEDKDRVCTSTKLSLIWSPCQKSSKFVNRKERWIQVTSTTLKKRMFKGVRSVSPEKARFPTSQSFKTPPHLKHNNKRRKIGPGAHQERSILPQTSTSFIRCYNVRTTFLVVKQGSHHPGTLTRFQKPRSNLDCPPSPSPSRISRISYAR